MSEIGTVERVLWGIVFGLNAGLVFLLLYRKNHRVFPFFFAYALLNLLQAVILFASYRLLRFYSIASFEFFWGSQALVMVARALAVAEICRRALGKYKSVLAFGWRVLLAVACVVFACSWAFGRHGRWTVVTTDQSLELALAVVIMVLFEIARWFYIELERTLRFLMTGFFLLSSYRALADWTLERSQTSVAGWNLIGTIVFLLSLSIWTWGLRQTQPRMTLAPG